MWIPALDRVHDRSVNCENAIHALCMKKKFKLSTHRAAMTHK